MGLLAGGAWCWMYSRIADRSMLKVDGLVAAHKCAVVQAVFLAGKYTQGGMLRRRLHEAAQKCLGCGARLWHARYI